MKSPKRLTVKKGPLIGFGSRVSKHSSVLVSKHSKERPHNLNDIADSIGGNIRIDANTSKDWSPRHGALSSKDTYIDVGKSYYRAENMTSQKMKRSDKFLAMTDALSKLRYRKLPIQAMTTPPPDVLPK